MKRIQLLLAVMLLMLCHSAFSREMLQDIEVKSAGDFTEIKAILTVPFKYKKHFPSRRGKIIQIQLGVDPKSVDSAKLKRRETIKPESNNNLKIRDVIYEGNVRGGPYLVLRFFEIVDFIVDQNNGGNEIVIRVKNKKVEADSPKASAVSKKAKPEVPGDTKKNDLDQMMRNARVALTNGENGKAILLFTELLKLKDHKHLIDAREYLGLARERNAQLALAKKEYEKYLKDHPKSPRVATVKQRLMTLNARMSAPKRELKESKRRVNLRRGDNVSNVHLFGQFSQIYYNAYIKKEGISESSNQQNSLLTFFNTTRRERSKNRETRLVFSGSHEADFLDSNKMESRVRSIYGEYKNKRNGLEVSLGRQTVNSGGVLGRFDGGLLGIKLFPKTKLFVVAGMPVDFIDHQELQTNKPMYGARLDFNEILKNWRATTYVIQQEIDGLVNRSAIGADARYIFDKTVFYSSIDFDVSYQKLNILTANYGWQVNKKTKINLHFNKRRSPIMLTSNALQGLTVQEKREELPDGTVVARTGIQFSSARFIDTARDFKVNIKNLLDLGISEKDIRQRAIDNTGHSTLISMAVNHSIVKDLDVSMNLTLSSYEAGKNILSDEEDVPQDTSFLPSDFDYTLYGNVIKRNFRKSRDILIGGLRFSNNETSNRYEINSTFRYPINKWWIDFKARAMFTQNKEKDKNSARFNPKVRAEYRYNKKITVESEVGTEINRSQLPGEDYTWTSANLGFRYLF